MKKATADGRFEKMAQSLLRALDRRGVGAVEAQFSTGKPVRLQIKLLSEDRALIQAQGVERIAGLKVSETGLLSPRNKRALAKALQALLAI